jgi:DnaJ-class molecular chaperone
MKKIFYEILGISKMQMLQTIKKAYRKALEHHPDKTLETNRQKKKFQISR